MIIYRCIRRVYIYLSLCSTNKICPAISSSSMESLLRNIRRAQKRSRCTEIYRRWILPVHGPNLSRAASPNFILRPEKCSPSRLATAVPFDYVVYAPNVIKITSIARERDENVFRRLGRFLPRLECRPLTRRRSSRRQQHGRKKRGTREAGKGNERERGARKESKFLTALRGAFGAALNWIESSRGNDEEESPSVHSFRVLNFNYFELRSETLGSERRSICPW